MAAITKTVKHHVSMGNYEFVEFEASVTLTVPPNAVGKVGQDEIALAFADADSMLHDALADDLKDAWEYTTEADSYVGVLPINYTPPEPEPRKPITRTRGRR